MPYTSIVVTRNNSLALAVIDCYRYRYLPQVDKWPAQHVAQVRNAMERGEFILAALMMIEKLYIIGMYHEGK